MSILRSIDKLGNSIKFKIKGEDFKTSLGGIITLIIGFTILVLAWYFGQDIYLRKQPTFKTKFELLDGYPVGEVSDSDIFFAAAVKSYDNKYITEPKYFEYKYSYHFYNFTTGSQVDLADVQKNMVRCNEEHVDNATLKYYKLSNFMCVKQGNIYIGGDWEEDFIAYPTFKIKRCDSDTEKKYNVTCATDKEMKDKFKTFYVTYYVQQNVVNPSNYEESYKQVYENELIGINLEKTNITSLIARIKFKAAHYFTDEGYFFEDLTDFYFIEFDKLDYQEESAYDDSLFIARFLMSKSLNTYTRAYIKVPDIIALVGGFISLAFSTIEFLFAFYVDNEFNLYLIKHLFKLEIEEFNNSDMNNLVKVEDIKYNNININNNNNIHINDSNIELKNFTNKEQNKIQNQDRKKLLLRTLIKDPNKKNQIWNKDIQNIIDFQNKKRKEIQIEWCERFFFVNCFCLAKKTNSKVRYELLKRADVEIKKQTEIINLLRTIDQFKLFMKLIITEHQYFMLKNKGRKIIVNTEDPSDENITNDIDFKDLDNLKFLDNKTKLIDFLKLKMDSLVNIDKILFGYLEDELKNGINEAIDKDKNS